MVEKKTSSKNSMYVSGVKRDGIQWFLKKGYTVLQQCLVSKVFGKEGLMDIIITHANRSMQYPGALRKFVNPGIFKQVMPYTFRGETRKASRVVMMQVAFKNADEAGQGITQDQLEELITLFNEACGTKVGTNQVEQAAAKKALDVTTVYLMVDDEETAKKIANPGTPSLNGRWHRISDGDTTRQVTLHTLQTSPKPYVYKPTRARSNHQAYAAPQYPYPYPDPDPYQYIQSYQFDTDSLIACPSLGVPSDSRSLPDSPDPKRYTHNPYAS
eukprot:TRINITY_DN21252_c0_g1_i1.p1 TRINITY_DN21252_c0_g1~~TRINITY_DN21252_c0_g1_i1.p1  ORF type:complete len:292 (+),score=76.17 TRINITY_DN21252_c0_g1_i1:66-878(+)